ncbi:MAG: hypothetical protein ABI597_10270 [Gammaproteobacteria bacterium]
MSQTRPTSSAKVVLNAEYFIDYVPISVDEINRQIKEVELIYIEAVRQGLKPYASPTYYTYHAAKSLEQNTEMTDYIEQRRQYPLREYSIVRSSMLVGNDAPQASTLGFGMLDKDKLDFQPTRRKP